MKFVVLTLFPEMFEGFLNASIIKRAIEDSKLEVKLVNIRDYAEDKHKQVDDYPFGGGAGMLMMIEPLVKAIRDNNNGAPIVLTSAQGEVFRQKKARELSLEKEVMIICGRYEGIDSRIENYIDQEISVGDYVLTGGELAAMIIIDSVCRLCDEVISPTSLLSESFNENLLEAPQYTKPVEFEGLKVPDVLLSGHHKNIETWKQEQALKTTKNKKPELYKKYLKEKNGQNTNK